MNDRYGWDDRDESERYRRHSGEGSHRTYDYDDQFRGRGRGLAERWRGEDDDWRSRSGFDRDRFPRRVGGYGGSNHGYGYGRQSRDAYGSQQSYAGQADRRQHYTSSDYGAGQQGDASAQPYFTGQQQGWEVPSSFGAPGTFGASYGGGTGTYGGGAGGFQGYGDDYREHSYSGAQNQRGFLQRAGDEIASWFGDEDAAQRREQDHRGRGPQGYTRSDERIREDANDRLTDDWRVDASGITVTVENGEVTLTGTVSHRDDKRRAEDVVEDISGVKHLQNNLRVQNQASWSRGTGTLSATSSRTEHSSATDEAKSKPGALPS